MTRIMIALLSLALSTPVLAAELTVRGVHRHVHHHYRLPPERHVVEKVSPPFSGNYLINGTWFTALSPRCSRWISGERIALVAGDWHGYCRTAVFRNLSRRATCELACRGW
jgi:hypothetical protein